MWPYDVSSGPSTSGAAIRYRVGSPGEIGVRVPNAYVGVSFNWQDAPSSSAPLAGSPIRQRGGGLSPRADAVSPVRAGPTQWRWDSSAWSRAILPGYRR